MLWRDARTLTLVACLLGFAAHGCGDDDDGDNCSPQPSLEDACARDEHCKTERDDAVSQAVDLCLTSAVLAASLHGCPGEEVSTVRLGDGYVGVAYYYDTAGALQGRLRYQDVIREGECVDRLQGTASEKECAEQCALCDYDGDATPCTGPDVAPLVAACKASKPDVPAGLLDCACEECRVVIAFGNGGSSLDLQRCLEQRCGGDDARVDAGMNVNDDAGSTKGM